jgi:hypothetical protein
MPEGLNNPTSPATTTKSVGMFWVASKTQFYLWFLRYAESVFD